jgi:hypothetical protein
MKRTSIAMAAMLVAAALATSASAVSRVTDFSAAKSAYAVKKAECKARAKAKHFGVHFIKRNRWIKDCIAGAN